MMRPVRAVVRRVRHELRRRLTNRGVILMYHRVAEEAVDPWSLCVTPANFAQQLKVLRSLGLRLVHVSQMAKELESGDLPRRTVAISFDDGYSDNYECAYPALEQYEAPATLFATAGYIGRNEEFWWDTLDRVFLERGSLPDALELTVSGRAHRWDLAEPGAGEANPPVEWRPFREPPTIRHRMHDELWSILVTAEPGERSRVIAELLRWAGLDPAPRPSRRPLTEQQLRQLGRTGLVEIGAHSLTHPALPSLSPEARAHELSASKVRLEELLQKPVSGCSYPQGRSTAELEQQTQNAGYSFACGSVGTAVSRRSNLYGLPRLSVRDWEENRFRSFVESHLAA